MLAIGNRLIQDTKWIAYFGTMSTPEIGALNKQKLEGLAQGKVLPQDTIQDLKRFWEAGQVHPNDKSAPHHCVIIVVCLCVSFVHCLWRLWQ